MSSIRVRIVGKFKAKTNGGRYWELTAKNKLIGEIAAATKRIVIKGDALFTIGELVHLQTLINDCHAYYLTINK